MFAKLYFIALPILFVLDMLWIGVIAKGFYQNQIGYLLKSSPNWIAIILFYLLYIAGLVLFVIAPSVEKGSWLTALVLGAFFGLIAYATYDLTNLGLTKNWPVLVTVVDIVWGACVAGLVSVATFFIATNISR